MYKVELKNFNRDKFLKTLTLRPFHSHTPHDFFVSLVSEMPFICETREEAQLMKESITESILTYPLTCNLRDGDLETFYFFMGIVETALTYKKVRK